MRVGECLSGFPTSASSASKPDLRTSIQFPPLLVGPLPSRCPVLSLDARRRRRVHQPACRRVRCTNTERIKGSRR